MAAGDERENKTVEKIVTLDALRSIRTATSRTGKRIVFTNGCFDLLHVGHAEYLAAARAEGDALIVGLNSDRSVKAIKGDRRPIVPEKQRAAVLAALECVDWIVLFDDPDPFNTIRSLMPDILVKGADWDEEEIIGADIVRAGGGRVVRVPVVSGVSTSGIIDRILRRYGNQ